MKLINRSQASKLPYAPTKIALTRQTRKNVIPEYFHIDGDEIYIDVESDAWKKYIEKRKSDSNRGIRSGGRKKPDQIAESVSTQKQEQPQKRQPKKNQVLSKQQPSPADEDEEIRQLSRRAAKAQLLEPILKNQKLEYENEMKKTELQKIAGNLIEYDLAEFLFLGYMERINLEILSLPQKIESIIHTHVMEGQTKEIVKLLKHENEKILIEIKKAQLLDVKKWKEYHKQNYKAKKR